MPWMLNGGYFLTLAYSWCGGWDDFVRDRSVRRISSSWIFQSVWFVLVITSKLRSMRPHMMLAMNNYNVSIHYITISYNIYNIYRTIWPLRCIIAIIYHPPPTKYTTRKMTRFIAVVPQVDPHYHPKYGRHVAALNMAGEKDWRGLVRTVLEHDQAMRENHRNPWEWISWGYSMLLSWKHGGVNL